MADCLESRMACIMLIYTSWSIAFTKLLKFSQIKFLMQKNNQCQMCRLAESHLLLLLIKNTIEVKIVASVNHMLMSLWKLPKINLNLLLLPFWLSLFKAKFYLQNLTYHNFLMNFYFQPKHLGIATIPLFLNGYSELSFFLPWLKPKCSSLSQMSKKGVIIAHNVSKCAIITPASV